MTVPLVLIVMWVCFGIWHFRYWISKAFEQLVAIAHRELEKHRGGERALEDPFFKDPQHYTNGKLNRYTKEQEAALLSPVSGWVAEAETRMVDADSANLDMDADVDEYVTSLMGSLVRGEDAAAMRVREVANRDYPLFIQTPLRPHFRPQSRPNFQPRPTGPITSRALRGFAADGAKPSQRVVACNHDEYEALDYKDPDVFYDVVDAHLYGSDDDLTVQVITRSMDGREVTRAKSLPAGMTQQGNDFTFEIDLDDVGLAESMERARRANASYQRWTHGENR